MITVHNHGSEVKYTKGHHIILITEPILSTVKKWKEGVNNVTLYIRKQRVSI